MTNGPGQSAGSRPWQPSASLDGLRFRAQVLAKIRAFFAAHNVMEVTTPVLAAAAATDPQIDSFGMQIDGQECWLQSSPEFHMKRLLAAGSGAIYQIGPAFRRDEQGRWHNREFSMLEWYVPGFDQHALMDQLQALVVGLSDELNIGSNDGNWPRHQYASLIQQYLGLDWSDCSAQRLRISLQTHIGTLPLDLDRNGLLDATMGLLIGPELGVSGPCFVHDFPPEQAALARLQKGADGQLWASRFELYWQGIELANGFYELTDAAEQGRRFAGDLQQRTQLGKSPVVMDGALLEALQAGLPDCAGVALGLDRLCALLHGQDNIASVLSFTAERA